MDKYIPTIPIRDIPKVTFVPIQLDDKLVHRQDLSLKLHKACSNGNDRKSKYRITFLTNNGSMKIHTTIWMVGEEFIILKENIYVPINSIINVT